MRKMLLSLLLILVLMISTGCGNVSDTIAGIFDKVAGSTDSDEEINEVSNEEIVEEPSEQLVEMISAEEPEQTESPEEILEVMTSKIKQPITKEHLTFFTDLDTGTLYAGSDITSSAVYDSFEGAYFRKADPSHGYLGEVFLIEPTGLRSGIVFSEMIYEYDWLILQGTEDKAFALANQIDLDTGTERVVGMSFEKIDGDWIVLGYKDFQGHESRTEFQYVAPTLEDFNEVIFNYLD